MWSLAAILDSTGIYIPRSRIAQKSMCLNVMVIAKLPFREVVPVYIPLRWQIVYHWALICIYFITHEVEHLFVCLKAIYISFSVDYFYFLCPYSFLLDWSFSPQIWENENNPFMCYKCCKQFTLFGFGYGIILPCKNVYILCNWNINLYSFWILSCL